MMQKEVSGPELAIYYNVCGHDLRIIDKSASSPPMLYPLESKKELFESGPPFPTRQLPICAEQLKNSPATRIYKKEKFQAWLTPWCPPPSVCLSSNLPL